MLHKYFPNPVKAIDQVVIWYNCLMLSHLKMNKNMQNGPIKISFLAVK